MKRTTPGEWDISDDFRALLFGTPSRDKELGKLGLNLHQSISSSDEFYGSLSWLYTMEAEILLDRTPEEIITVLGDKLETMARRTRTWVDAWQKKAREIVDRDARAAENKHGV